MDTKTISKAVKRALNSRFPNNQVRLCYGRDKDWIDVVVTGEKPRDCYCTDRYCSSCASREDEIKREVLKLIRYSLEKENLALNTYFAHDGSGDEMECIYLKVNL